MEPRRYEYLSGSVPGFSHVVAGYSEILPDSHRLARAVRAGRVGRWRVRDLRPGEGQPSPEARREPPPAPRRVEVTRPAQRPTAIDPAALRAVSRGRLKRLGQEIGAMFDTRAGIETIAGAIEARLTEAPEHTQTVVAALAAQE